MRPCQWIAGNAESWECIHCGLKVSKKHVPEEPYSVCSVASAFIREAEEPRVVDVARKFSGSGPGSQLKKLLARIGINATPTCSCNARAVKMDEWGPDVCEEKIDEIVGWLREEATKRKLPFLDAAGRLIIRKAISNARKKAAAESCQMTTDSPSTARSGSGDTAS